MLSRFNGVNDRLVRVFRFCATKTSRTARTATPTTLGWPDRRITFLSETLSVRGKTTFYFHVFFFYLFQLIHNRFGNGRFGKRASFPIVAAGSFWPVGSLLPVGAARVVFGPFSPSIPARQLTAEPLKQFPPPYPRRHLSEATRPVRENLNIFLIKPFSDVRGTQSGVGGKNVTDAGTCGTRRTCDAHTHTHTHCV